MHATVPANGSTMAYRREPARGRRVQAGVMEKEGERLTISTVTPGSGPRRLLAPLMAAALAALLLTGCRGGTASETAGGAPSETSETAGGPSETGNDALTPFLPATASFNGPEDFVSSWTVTKNDDGTIRIKDTVGDFDTIYTLKIENGCLKQISLLDMSGETQNAEATWFCLPPASFQNEYTLHGKTVKESATEQWVDDPSLGQVLEVRTVRTVGGETTTTVDHWATGLGLVSRVTTDANGKVTEKREIIFAGS